MSGNEHTPRDAKSDDSIFAEMMGQLQQNRDIGIVEYEGRAKEICEGLVSAYIGIDVDSDDMDIILDEDAIAIEEAQLEREIEDARIDLGVQWMHEDDVARVTGRVYVNDAFINVPVPSEWGKRKKDENIGLEYYVIEGAKLRSMGVDVVPIYDDDGALIDIRASYDFTLPDDDEGKNIVFAFAEDLLVHDYEIPSPQEAIKFLEANYPAECALIDKTISPDGETPLPARLQNLVAQLQAKFLESEEFMKCVEQYIQHFVNFNQMSPYRIVIENGLRLFDGKNIITQGDDEAMWPYYLLNRGISIEGNLPLVKLIKQKDGSVDCYIQVIRYNQQSGDADPEFIRAKVGSVASFRSTEAEKSLLSLLKFDAAQLMAVSPELFDFDSEEQDDSGIELQLEIQSSVESSPVPLVIEELEVFEAELLQVAQKLKEARQRLYDTPEDAVKAAYAFIQAEMGELFRLKKMSDEYELMVSGEGVMHANATIEVTPVDHGELTLFNFSYTFDPEEPFMSLEPGDKRQVLLEAPYVAVERVESDTSYGTDRYRIQPSLAVRPRVYQQTLSMVDDLEFVAARIEERMLVSLDESAEITIPLLEGYRESQALINTLMADDDTKPVAELLQDLQDTAIGAINKSEYVDFNHVELFAMLDEFAKGNESGKRIVSVITGLIEALLIRRHVKVNGEMRIKDHDNGGYALLADGKSDALLSGKVMDVRNDIDGDDFFLVVHDETEDELVSIRMRTITQLMF